MQISVNVDCTPQEARSFLGLPDLSPLHAIYLSRMEAFARDGVQSEDVERLYKAWGSGMSEGLEQFQRLFWSAAGSGGGVAPR